MSITKYNTVADPKYLDWLEYPITFSRADQWVDIPYPGHFPLVLDPTIRNVRFKKVLIEDFDTAYHAILGRPALAKFIVMPHYVYLVLKILME